MRYPVPAAVHRVEQEISRSRFITTVARASTIDEATDFIRRVGAEFADATHNCWAYVIGPPGDTARIGMSDAGEPHGTAGRPMLSALLYSGVGDVVAVVTRYYGGTKLGTGGLVRAYGGGVQQALATLPGGSASSTSSSGWWPTTLASTSFSSCSRPSKRRCSIKRSRPTSASTCACLRPASKASKPPSPTPLAARPFSPKPSDRKQDLVPMTVSRLRRQAARTADSGPG